MELNLLSEEISTLRNTQADERAGFPPKAEERGGLASPKILAGDFWMFSKGRYL